MIRLKTAVGGDLFLLNNSWFFLYSRILFIFKAGATLGANRVSAHGGRKGEGGAFDGLRKFVNFENEKSIKCDKVEQNEQVTKKREMSLTK